VFAIDGTEWTHGGPAFETLASLAPLLLEHKGTSAMTGFHQEVTQAGQSWDETFQGCPLRLIATNTLNPRGEANNLTGGEVPGCGLICRTAPGEFLLVGSRVEVEWHASPGKTLQLRFAETAAIRADVGGGRGCHLTL